MNPEYLDPSDRSVAADALLRQEPEEEEEDDGKDDGNDDEGYLE